MLWFRLALIDLLRNRRFSLFFILNLSIGLVGFISLNSFNNSLENYLKDNLKEILTADLMVSASRQLNQTENQAVESVLGGDKRESRQITFFSMISSSSGSKLAHVVAIDRAFPLYGSMISKKNHLSGSDNSKLTLSKAWLTPDLATALEIERGGTLRIGDKNFIVDDIVTAPPDASVTSIELAPKIYIGLSEAEETGLLKFGSRINFVRYYRFPAGADIKTKTERLREKISALSNGSPTISVYDSEDVNQNLNRLFGYFTGYMGLISIVALFLAGIGTSYLFRGYLNTKLKEIAILMTLGARRIDAYLLFLFQVVLLGTISTLFSVVLSFFLLPLFPVVLQKLIPQNFQPATDMESVLMAFIPGILGSVIFCLPMFTRVHALKPVMLLQGVHTLAAVTELQNLNPFSSDRSVRAETVAKQYLPSILSSLPALLTFWLLSVWQTSSFERGSLFSIGSLCVMGVLTAIGWILIHILKRVSYSGSFILKIAFRNLYRNQISSISCFVTIAMGAFLINVIPQIRNGIQEEISQPEGMKIPGFFLIDIQPEQLSALISFLESESYALTNLSPIIRGRILKVNGKGFYDRFDEGLDGKTGEKQSIKSDNQSIRGRYRRREFNFSYRPLLDSSEKVVKGSPLITTPWKPEDNRQMEISLEEGFAERFDLKIGDVMSFDIQGTLLEGRVVNLRKVRWNSFQPNFFILFQRGVLDDAPKTFLASTPQMRPSERRDIQNALVRKFPNISLLDVNQTVKQILDITDRLAFAINFMAGLAIVSGLVVLFSIARHETHVRSWEINLLKVLGAGFRDIRTIILIEFGLLGFMAAFFSTLLSLLASYGIAWFLFERLWVLRWEYSLFSMILITLTSIGTAVAATGRVLRQKGAALLSE